ncbi:MAG: hypothetical protein QF457_05975 [SAR324 cluster bacterium]|nr:hypothetical protein [SAR324 cluster bacterium]
MQRSADEPLEALREKALDGQCPSNFAEAVKDKGNGLLEIIAEVKPVLQAESTWKAWIQSLSSVNMPRAVQQQCLF